MANFSFALGHNRFIGTPGQGRKTGMLRKKEGKTGDATTEFPIHRTRDNTARGGLSGAGSMPGPGEYKRT